MIIVRCYGGLGNQMFQYAFYKYLELNNEVYLDISDFNFENFHYGFELERVFNIQLKLPTRKMLKPMCINNSNLVKRVLKKSDINICRVTEVKEFIEFGCLPQKEFSEPYYFDGFWQDINYIMPNEKLLRKIFKFDKNLSSRNVQLKNLITQVNSVSVHIRRGDYINDSNLSCICNIKYYTNAIKYIFEKVRNPQYIVFSDDISWCKSNITLPDTTIYVDWNIKEKSYFDMYLMSLCKNNIIANSTFSWWSAWLNMNEKKIVILPKRWFAKSIINNLVLDDWIPLE